MFSLIESTVKPLMLNTSVLDIAYALYLQAPQTSSPTIDLKELSRKTGSSLLECRNVIVEANKLGRFPNCTLSF